MPMKIWISPLIAFYWECGFPSNEVGIHIPLALGIFFLQKDKNAHLLFKREKYILPPNVSLLFQSCLQSEKICNVPQPSFKKFQCCQSVT
jgi:hypothetical protein